MRRGVVVAALSVPLASCVVFHRGSGPRCDGVWLALEAKGVPYAVEEVFEAADVPRVVWDDGSTTEGAPLAIMERLDADYAESGARLFLRPRAGIDRVRHTMRRFAPVFPRRTREDAHCPFMFMAEDGAPTPRDSVRVTLEEIDEILEENDEGDFFAGDALTAVDCAWAPYLARWAIHVPLLHDALFPRSAEFPALRRWFDAMDDRLPCFERWVDDEAHAWRDALGPPPTGGFRAALPDVAREAGRAVVEIDPWRETERRPASASASSESAAKKARMIADLTKGLF